MNYLYLMAREEGKYRAIGGHSATPSTTLLRDGDYGCSVCGRPVSRRDSARSGWAHKAPRKGRRS